MLRLQRFTFIQERATAPELAERYLSGDFAVADDGGFLQWETFQDRDHSVTSFMVGGVQAVKVKPPRRSLQAPGARLFTRGYGRATRAFGSGAGVGATGD